MAQAAAACNATEYCEAFGIYDNEIQLHGCVETVANSDWTIYVRDSSGDVAGALNDNPPPTNGYHALPHGVNVDEEKCTKHPSPWTLSCDVPPPPPAPPQHYTTLGSLDVFTMENTPFYWQGKMYLLENIGCNYWGHAGAWQPEVFGNHSYARVRELESGRVISNIR